MIYIGKGFVRYKMSNGREYQMPVEQAEFNAGMDEFFDLLFDKVETGDVLLEQVGSIFSRAQRE